MIEQKISTRLQTLEWQIQDAKRELNDAANAMARRADEATRDTTAMMADQPCSLSWVEFAEGDVRKAREAKERLRQLIEQQKLLASLVNAK